MENLKQIDWLAAGVQVVTIVIAIRAAAWVGKNMK